MSELENQAGEFEQDIEQLDEAETNESESAELAPDSDMGHEENPEQAKVEEAEEAKRVNQDKVNQAINKKHREMMEAREEADRYKQQLSQYQQSQQSATPQLPPEPDPFSDSYDEDKRAYNEALRTRAVFEAEQNVRRQYDDHQAQLQQQKQAVETQEKVKVYAEKAKTFGIKPEELQQYGSAAGQYLSNDLAMAIVADDEGPLITKYLAQNPMETMQLAQMDPYSAAMYVERTVRAKARELKPKQSNAPKPTTRVDGSGANVTHTSSLLKGSRFE